MGGWPVAATPPPHTDKTKVNPFMQWAVASIQGFYFSGPQPGGGGPQSGAGATPSSDLPGGHPPAPAPSQASPVSSSGHSHPTTQAAKPDDQARGGGGGGSGGAAAPPVTISAVTALETGRQAVQSMPGHYNHGLHPMVPVDPAHHHHHQQQQQQQQQHQQHHTQHQQQTQPPQQHQSQQQQSGECANQSSHSSHGPSNDTAFPGGTHRHNYNVQGGGQHVGGQGPVVPGHNSHPTKQVQGEKQVLAPLTKNKLYTEENGQVIAYNGSQEHLEHHRRGVKVERVYDCSDCDKAFTREEHLKRHAKSHTDEPVHRCEVVGCNKAYTRKERLTRHYKVAHLGQEPERPFWCPECGKDFQRKEHLTRHQRNIHGPGGSIGLAHSQHSDQSQGSVSPVSMTILGPAQPSNHHNLSQQQAGEGGGGGGGGSGGGGGNNHGQGQLRCTYEGCPKTYSRREHLNRHIKLHMGIEPERPYYCLDCGKTFTRKEHLLRHRRSHTGETPYHCPGVDCSKQFARKEHLKRHMRVHTGEHPYPCSECGRSFGRRERLLKHLKSHGIGVMPGAPIRAVHHMQQHHQPKKEFKKEPEFISSDQPQALPHGVFGEQTNQLLRMIAQKGPLTPEQLGMGQAPPTQAENLLSNPEVARALSNPEIVRAFSNPEVVKAFAFSPPKRAPASGGTPPASTQAPPAQAQPPPQPSQAAAQPPVATQAGPVVTRGPDIANSPAVPPELSKLPSGFSIFPVVPTTMSSTGQVVGQEQGQVCVSAPANSYYQAGPSYVASMAPHRPELTTIPMAWTGWPMTTMQPVNMRSPAKLEPAEAKHWEPAAAAYFRSPFS